MKALFPHSHLILLASHVTKNQELSHLCQTGSFRLSRLSIALLAVRRHKSQGQELKSTWKFCQPQHFPPQPLQGSPLVSLSIHSIPSFSPNTPNPSDLPLELFSHVLYLVHVPADPQPLCRLALVSRAWAFAVTPQVYSSWVYNGARHSFKRLWLFLRTVLTDSYIACLVRTVHIGNWGLNPYTLLDRESRPYARLEGEFDCPLDHTDMELVHRAITQAGLTHIESDMIGAIHQADRRALMALLLASLPRLAVIRAHIPVSDKYLASLLRQSLGNQDCENSGYLTQLRELYVFAEVPVPDTHFEMDDMGSPSAPLRLEDLWPVLFLKSLRKLSLYELDTEGLAALIKRNRRHRTCYVNSLTLTTHVDSRCESGDIQAMLTLPDALSSLSLSMYEPDGWERESISLFKVSNTDIWNALRKHQTCIQYLDIFRSGQRQNCDVDPSLSYFGSLNTYIQLKHLCIQLPVLTDVGALGKTEHTPLTITLPASLKTFTLYGKCCYSFPLDIAMLIQEMMTGKMNSYPVLESITLEDKYLTQAVLGNPTLHTKVKLRFQRLCGAYFIEPDCATPRAGHCLASWGDMPEMRIDGNRLFFEVMNRMFYIHWSREKSTGFSLPYYDAAVHILPFTDHTGDVTRLGYMVFRNYSAVPLPPLFPFIIYFTNSHTLPGSIDLRGLYIALKMKADEVHPRLDIYFLPGATEMDCLVHYQREQIARGSYRDQIDAFEDYTSRHSSKFHLAPQPPPPGRLPGMSTSYCLEYEHYQGALFICTGRDWRDGEQSLQCVQFNSPDLPKGYLWHEINISDMEDQDTELPTTQNVKRTQEASMTQENVSNTNELNISSFTRNSWPINEQSPAFDAERMSYTVGGRMEEAYRWTGLGEAQDVWKKVSKLGWLNWC